MANDSGAASLKGQSFKVHYGGLISSSGTDIGAPHIGDSSDIAPTYGNLFGDPAPQSNQF